MRKLTEAGTKKERERDRERERERARERERERGRPMRHVPSEHRFSCAQVRRAKNPSRCQTKNKSALQVSLV